LFDILPYDSPSALELLLRVLSSLPAEVEIYILYIHIKLLLIVAFSSMIVIYILFFYQYERRNEVKRAKLREIISNSWCQTAWFLQQVFSTYNPDSQGNDLTLYTLGLDCAQSWLKVGHLPLDITGQIYPHLLAAATYYAPKRYIFLLSYILNFM